MLQWLGELEGQLPIDLLQYCFTGSTDSKVQTSPTWACQFFSKQQPVAELAANTQLAALLPNGSQLQIDSAQLHIWLTAQQGDSLLGWLDQQVPLTDVQPANALLVHATNSNILAPLLPRLDTLVLRADALESSEQLYLWQAQHPQLPILVLASSERLADFNQLGPSVQLLPENSSAEFIRQLVTQRLTQPQLHQITDQLAGCIWQSNQQGRISYVSRQAQPLLNLANEQLLGTELTELWEQTSPGYLQLRSALEHGETFSDLVLARPGCKRKFNFSGQPKHNFRGQLIGYAGYLQDITERWVIQQHHQLASDILHHTPEALMVTDSQLNIIHVNQAFVQTTGYSEAEILGETPKKLSSDRHNAEFYQQMWQGLNDTDSWQGEVWNRRKNGEIYPEWLNITVIRDHLGEISHYAGIFSDISVQEHVRMQLHNLAYYDTLTGLPNRELFYDRLDKALQLAKREQQKVAVLFLDLDHFKKINDSLGHRVGDNLLKMIAEVVSAQLRESDTVARIGGDEFTILMPGIDSKQSIEPCVERILEAVNASFCTEDGLDLFASASIGISVFPEHGQDIDTLLKNADTAMYAAKDGGRKHYRFYDASIHNCFTERLSLESDLRKALESDQFSLAFQPQIEATSGRITGFEALLRWQHPSLGWISPAKFIPVAEEIGLIVELGDWVLEQACQQLKHWQQKYGGSYTMAVNLSGHQVYQRDITERVVELLEQLQLKADSLELELTESFLVENIETTVKTLSALRSLGVKLAIDDFGTGYSSLSYLKRFDLDKLKIDKSFIDDINGEGSDAQLVVSIINMANSLNMEVIAEGVETEQQLMFLKHAGCQEIQGYYFSPPKSAADIELLLAKRSSLAK